MAVDSRVSVRRRLTYLLLLGAGATAGSVSARAEDPVASGETAPGDHRVYLEVLGSGLLYSLNYEIMISDHSGVRIGVGGLPVTGATYIVGLGMPTMVLGSGDHRAVVAVGVGIGWIEDIAVLESQEVLVAYGIGSLGYQFQPRSRGIFVRGCFTPVVTDQEFSIWGGASVGTAF